MIPVRKKIRVLVTAGGTGGHLYPALAVIDHLLKVGEGNISIVFAGNPGRFSDEFAARDIKIMQIAAGKLRRYFALENILTLPIFLWSLLQAMVKMFFFMPDVIFSKGGPGSLPVVLAAAWYRIPVLAHESDAVPSITTRAAARWVRKIALTFSEAAASLPKSKTFISGTPIRFSTMLGHLDRGGSKTIFGFAAGEPLVLVLGGSQGSVRINNLITDQAENFLPFVQILHQTGAANISEMESARQEVLRRLPPESEKRYIVVGYLSSDKMAAALQAADVIIARAGAGTISEIALFGKPAILIPLKESANDHQSANGYSYAKTGAAVVIEENNFRANLLLGEIRKILDNAPTRQKMEQAAFSFAKPEATEVIARELLAMCGVFIR